MAAPPSPICDLIAQGNRVKEESSSFLKKEPKNFCLLGARLRPERGSKSFLLLFFKKEDLSCLIFAWIP
jgi:hypothetical protein